MGLPSKATLARFSRELAFLLIPLPLSGVWLAALVSAWAVTASLAITPLVVPLLMGTALTVRGVASVEAWLSRGLLGTSPSLPRWDWGSGFWRRALMVLRDPWLWRAQAYLALRITAGFALAAGLLVAIAAGLALLTLPLYYYALDGGEALHRHVHTLPQALVGVPAGLLVLAVAVLPLHRLARLWASLSVNLLGAVKEQPDIPATSVSRSGGAPPGDRVDGARGVEIHALATAGLVTFLIVIWGLTSRGYFWPVWPLLALSLPLAIHGWVVLVAPAEWWREHRLDAEFAIHAGVWLALLTFLTAVWGVAGGGYFWPVWPLLLGLVATGAHAAALRGRREQTRRLNARISTLETSRAGAVDVQDAELRRIERDLHDGAQARLVALGMSIGMAEQKLASEPEAAAALLADARAGAGAALRELRDLARGIHPPVLADRGLDAAVRALAAGSPVSVTVSATIGERPQGPVESAAYFVVAESLANAGKHAGASRVDVRIVRHGATLAVEVHDDGHGGADPAGGGLSGLRRRVEALDGTLRVTSPRGGPTTIRAELPCG